MRNGLCSIIILDIAGGALRPPPPRTEVPSQNPALVRVKPKINSKSFNFNVFKYFSNKNLGVLFIKRGWCMTSIREVFLELLSAVNRWDFANLSKILESHSSLIFQSRNLRFCIVVYLDKNCACKNMAEINVIKNLLERFGNHCL